MKITLKIGICITKNRWCTYNGIIISVHMFNYKTKIEPRECNLQLYL